MKKLKEPDGKHLFVPEYKLSQIDKIEWGEIPLLTDSKTAVKVFWDYINQKELYNQINVNEFAFVLYLNKRNKVLGITNHTIGGVDGTVMDLRLMFAQGLLLGATSMIVAHNHPTGNLMPSEADRRIAQKLVQAGKFLEMPVVDFLILTSNSGYLSFTDDGLINSYAKGGQFNSLKRKIANQVNLTNELRGEENDDYGTFEIYKRGGEIEVKISSSKDNLKDKYNWILDDYDKDGLANADDVNPYSPDIRQPIDSPSMASGIDYLLDLKQSMDAAMFSFVDDLKEVAPDKSKIYARTKTPYSILNKLIKKRLLNPKTGLTDLIGTTIVTENKKQLDKVKDQIVSGKLGKVIELEDMYANPKQGYRAYHFLIEKNGLPIEVQLKTKRQKAVNQLSHEPYKLGKLDADKLIRTTELADKADNGDRTAIKQFDEFMAQPNIEEVFYTKQGNEKYAKGGRMGYERLVKKVAANYEGKAVPSKYQSKYGKRYDADEAKKVGYAVATKVYGKPMARMADGGGTSGTIQGLNADEFAYLYIKRGIKSPFREEYLKPIGLWKTAKAQEIEKSLIAKGLLNSAGAITEAGKTLAKQIDTEIQSAFSSGYIGSMTSSRVDKFNNVKEKFASFAEGGEIDDLITAEDRMTARQHTIQLPL